MKEKTNVNQKEIRDKANNAIKSRRALRVKARITVCSAVAEAESDATGPNSDNA
jgi:hypothetical protein